MELGGFLKGANPWMLLGGAGLGLLNSADAENRARQSNDMRVNELLTAAYTGRAPRAEAQMPNTLNDVMGGAMMGMQFDQDLKKHQQNEALANAQLDYFKGLEAAQSGTMPVQAAPNQMETFVPTLQPEFQNGVSGTGGYYDIPWLSLPMVFNRGVS